MSEIFKPFETFGGVTVPQVLAFLVLVAPGFISLRVYDMQRGGPGRQAKDVMIDIVMYSLASDSVVYGASALTWSVVPHTARIPVTVVVAACVFVVMPIALAAGCYELQRKMMRLGTFPDTLTTPWMRMVNRITSEGVNAGVIATMHDGRIIGARIGPIARETARSDDLLLDEVWTTDANGATLIEASPSSYGLLLGRADCQLIEFVRLDAATGSPSDPRGANP